MTDSEKIEWLTATNNALMESQELLAGEVKELRECLRWYLDNDPTNDVTYEIDKNYLKGKYRAMKALGEHK